LKKIYIVTGAAGFLGNNIIRKLEQNKDNEIRALVLPQEKTVSLEGLNCKIYKGDVTKKESLDEIFNIGESDAEIYVIHCAAIVYIKTKYNPKVYDVNVGAPRMSP
jgi:dihydroflavonol-4-reductase